MDNPTPAADAVNHHIHVFDPQLGHVHHPETNVSSDNANEDQQQHPGSSDSASTLNLSGSPIKRRPGRPKGSTKKNLLAGEVLPPKIKRPVGRPRKDGLPAGSVGPSRVKREATGAIQQVGLPVVSDLR
jgi:hypothetical protein